MELDRWLQCHCVHCRLVVVTACIGVKVVKEHLHPVHCADRKLRTHTGLGSIIGVDGRTDGLAGGRAGGRINV